MTIVIVTSLGIVFFAALLVASATIGPMRGAAAVTAVFTPFYDSAVIVVSEIGLSAYYVGLLVTIAIFLACRSGLHKSVVRRVAPFWVYVLAVSLIAPIIFAGIPVFSSDLSLDEQAGGRSSALELAQSHLAQLTYLSLNLAALSLGIINRRFAVLAMSSAAVSASSAVILAAIGTPFPHRFFDNAPNNFYASIYDDRLRGFLAEPSHFGALLTATGAYFFARLVSGGRRVAVLPVLILCVVGIVTGGSGTAIVGSMLAATFFAASALIRTLKSRKLPLVGFFLSLVLFAGVSLSISSVYGFIRDLVNVKLGTASASTRAEADLAGLDSFLTTFGLGLGLGSTRTSSLFILLLANIGIVGTILFLRVVAQALNSALSRADIPLAAGFVALLITYSVSNANFSSPMLWSLLGGCLVARDLRIPRTEVTNHPRVAYASLS